MKVFSHGIYSSLATTFLLEDHQGSLKSRNSNELAIRVQRNDFSMGFQKQATRARHMWEFQLTLTPWLFDTRSFYFSMDIFSHGTYSSIEEEQDPDTFCLKTAKVES